jgi:hypothetical protein
VRLKRFRRLRQVYEYVAEAIDALEERRDYRRSLAILTNLMLTYVYNVSGSHAALARV